MRSSSRLPTATCCTTPRASNPVKPCAFSCIVVDWPVRLMPLSPNPDAGAGSDSIAAASAESRSFEMVYHELQQVVAQLEDGGLDLERAILLFERGGQLVQMCERIVEQAQLRVTRLAAESGSPLADAPAES